jgi:hypothetical protein
MPGRVHFAIAFALWVSACSSADSIARYNHRGAGFTVVGTAGAEELNLRVEARSPWHLSVDFPSKLALADGREFLAADSTLRSEAELAFVVRGAPGAAPRGTISFGLCRGDSCERVDHDFAL